jgi:hypothetical protein
MNSKDGKQQPQVAGFFQELENTRPFLKIAFEGFAGSGKTFTASRLAIGLHKFIGSNKPIVFYDTEKSLKALKPFFDKEGIKVLVRESRSLTDLTKTIELCESGTSDILVIDSITHVWESFMEAYKTEKKRTYLQMLDWGVLKPKWKREFSDPLVQSHLHIIFTGRASYEYDQEINTETGKKELIKTGIKMKVEGETEYEPDIVVLMDKGKTMIKKKMTLIRVASIIKDRTTLIDGKEFKNPTYRDFEPAVKLLLNGTAKNPDFMENKDSFQDFEKEQYQRKTAREIALEEIEGIIGQMFPGSTKDEKKIKTDIVDNLFHTTSWKAVTGMPIADLQTAVNRLKTFKVEASKYFKSVAEDGLAVDFAHLLSLLPTDEVDDGEGLNFDKDNPLGLETGDAKVA